MFEGLYITEIVSSSIKEGVTVEFVHKDQSSVKRKSVVDSLRPRR